MTDEVITVNGLQEVQKSLYSYSQKLGDHVVYGALRQGANIMRKAIYAQIDSSFKVHTGNLRRGFTVSRSKIHRGQSSGDALGVYVTLKKKGKAAPFYGRMLNDGWTPSGSSKKVAGRNYVQVAFEANKEAALTAIVLSAQAGAELLARKVGL